MNAPPRHVVEAQSYAPLINLASNPPRYPRNPSKAPLKPLVLYIVRVPGKRDVFLSPLKPPTESSISPALIEAALYYIHVSTPDDKAVLRAIEEEKRLNKPLPRVNRNPPPFGLSAPIQRKPVPGTELKPPSIPRRPVSPDTNIPFQTGADNEGHHQPRTRTRSPQAPGLAPGGSPESQRNPILAQRPLPPIPSDPIKHLDPEAAPNYTDNKAGSGRSRRDTQPGNPYGGSEYLTPPTAPQWRASWDGGQSSILLGQNPSYNVGYSRLSPERTSKDHQRTAPSFFQQGGRRSGDKTKEPPPPFHLTLIRRDTTNNVQWNVGNITNCISQSSPEVALDGTITIEILTLGYKKLGAESISFGVKERPSYPDPTANDTTDDPRRFIRHLTLTNRQSHRGHGSHHSNASINSLPPLNQTTATTKTPPFKTTARQILYLQITLGRHLHLRHGPQRPKPKMQTHNPLHTPRARRPKSPKSHQQRRCQLRPQHPAQSASEPSKAPISPRSLRCRRRRRRSSSTIIPLLIARISTGLHSNSRRTPVQSTHILHAA
ncbi:uncharacterized protein BDCG_09101 [Blastomyces dermatitidis ER-3]|uniref:Uncharacterized protein n=1 Tax=Ajellomyces dermatitidis (strain ER-3 / ATCC MYA-2586) TaxID=559297 RepID=A0ABM9YGA0_AJEDR|nr:uncharacterized protein BDCG_09101 [Blastomyces dermatitidis ER-3]EEQ85832.2 hypothetical protein BDCG_09101 [Blastomyces dermatitidis ER-3]